jgi:tetraacyldisaccharide 4'-kinase
VLDAQGFREVVSGRRRGQAATLTRALFSAAELPYCLAMRWRNTGYDRGRYPVRQVPVPVVSVGNLTLGGTGKTPMVAWLARWFGSRGLRVAIISRGYGARSRSPNDEAMELAQQLPDVVHLQHPDRATAALNAIRELEAQLILLDDGFQHRQLARDLDIVLIDAAEPFGYGRVFPRGMLREPLSGLARADVVALTRVDMADDARRTAIRQTAGRLAGEAVWMELRHAPHCLRSNANQTCDVRAFAGRSVAAFCGIGNPAAFQHTLKECGCQVPLFHEFPDHHAYPRRDVQWLTEWVSSRDDVCAVLCTQKDLVKLGVDRLGDRPLWALSVVIEPVCGQDGLEAKLRPLLSRALPPPTGESTADDTA